MLHDTPFNAHSLPANMRNKIAVTDGGCWEWTGALNSRGYGSVQYSGRVWSSHRAAYTALVGEIPEGLHIDHLCRSIRCCNPAHLEAVTQKVNSERRPDANKSHCKHGHAMDAENTIIKRKPNGFEQRNCRECERAAQRRRRAQRSVIVEKMAA